jgi:hypothetical protein
LHSGHYADADDAKIEVNRQFLSDIEVMFGTRNTLELGFALNIFVDSSVEAKKG